MRWSWWIYCRKCGHWASGETVNFRNWSCIRCGSHNIKGGINYEEWEEE